MRARGDSCQQVVCRRSMLETVHAGQEKDGMRARGNAMRVSQE